MLTKHKLPKLGVITGLLVVAPFWVSAMSLLETSDRISEVSNPILTDTESLSWGPDVRLTSTPAQTEDPDITIDSNNDQHIVWIESGSVYYRKQDLLGNVLVPDKQIVLTGILGGAKKSVVAKADENNNIHVSWSDGRDSTLGYTEVYYMRLDNNGNEVLAPRRLTFDLPNWSIVADVVSDTSQNVHIFWNDTRGFGGAVYYEKLDPQGNTLVDDKKITIHGSLSTHGVAIDPSDNIHFIYVDDSITGSNEVFYKKIDNSGNDIIAYQQLTNTGGDKAASLTLDADSHLQIIWGHSVQDFYSRIVYRKMDLYGATLVNNKIIHDAIYQYMNNPQIKFDSLERGHVLWAGRLTTLNHQLQYLEVDNEGNVVMSGVVISQGSGTSFSPESEVDVNNNLHLVWMDNRDDNYEVYYKQSGTISTRLYGSVTLQGTSTPVDDAWALIMHDNTVVKVTKTDSMGFYQLYSFDSGTYDVVFYKNGFDITTIEDVVINLGDNIEQNGVLTQPQVDLFIEGVDVLQVVETEYLIANKPTVIRIRAKVNGVDRLSGVSASVHVTGPNIDSTFNITDETVKNSYTPLETAYGDDAIELYYTPLFEGTYQFDVTVNSDFAVDGNLDNNLLSVSKTFYEVPDPKITIIPIITPTTSVDEATLLGSYELAEKTFPFSDNVIFDVKPYKPLILETEIEYPNYLLLQLSCLQLKYYKDSFLTSVVGKAALEYQGENKFDEGFGHPILGVSWSTHNPNNPYTLKNIFAHELYHLLSLKKSEEYDNYPPIGLPLSNRENPFDVKERVSAYNWRSLLGNEIDPGTVRRSFRGRPPYEVEFDYDMSWVRQVDYNFLALKQIILGQSIKRLSILSQGDYLVFSGIIDSSDNYHSQPIYHLSGEYTATPNDENGLYSIELFDNSQNLINSLQFSPSSSTGSNDKMFSLIIPDDPAFHGYKIVKDGIEIFTESTSENPPSIQIISPNGGENFTSGNIEISWQANDIDADSLKYDVLISEDSGQTYNPISVGYETTSLILDSQKLFGCLNSCLVKVIANDGFYETEDISDSPFSIAKKSPSVFINSPIDGLVVASGSEVIFEGNGYDPEDGVLSGVQLNWSSNIDGNLGTGDYLVDSSLSEGLHTITLQAQDSDLNISNTSIQLNVLSDQDNDAMSDSWETAHSLNTNFDDSFLDPDKDGLDNLSEFRQGSDPNVWAPYLKSISQKTVNERSTVTLKPELFGNPQDHQVSYTIDSPLFTWDGVYFRWKTGPTSSGNYLFTLTATDETQQSDSTQIPVTINNTCRVYNKYTKKWDCESVIIESIKLEANIY